MNSGEEKILKPKSFRIDDATAEKFKEIAAQIGGSQQETLSKLIEAFEFQSGKMLLSDHRADIEKFEKYVTALTRMYMGCLEDNQNITETIRTEFAALLTSKDNVIQNLQEKICMLETSEKVATTQANSLFEENKQLQDKIINLEENYQTKITDMQKNVVDKESLNRILTENCEQLKNQLNTYVNEHTEYLKIKAELEKTQAKISDLIKENNSLKENNETLSINTDTMINKIKEQHEEHLKSIQEKERMLADAKILELEKKHHAEIRSLEEQKRQEINKYQQKYLSVLEDFQKKFDEIK